MVQWQCMAKAVHTYARPDTLAAVIWTLSLISHTQRFRTITLSEKNITWAHCETSYLRETRYQLMKRKVLINSANVSLTAEQLLEWNFQLTRAVYQPEAFHSFNRLTSKKLKSKKRGSKTNENRHQSKPKTQWKTQAGTWGTAQGEDKDLQSTTETQVCRKEVRKRTKRGGDKQNITWGENYKIKQELYKPMNWSRVHVSAANVADLQQTEPKNGRKSLMHMSNTIFAPVLCKQKVSLHNWSSNKSRQRCCY